jgi:4'-phosphopantetheinyl transferase EntD
VIARQTGRKWKRITICGGKAASETKGPNSFQAPPFRPGFSDVTHDESSGAIPPHLSDRLDILARAAHPQLRAACREIAVGDELALTPAELRPMDRAIASVRRASGAARIVAKALLAKLGAPPGVELPRSASGAPQWPPGFVGSLAHDGQFAVAAVAPASAMLGVGIDIEPPVPLPEDLLDMIATANEREQLKGDLVSARLLFCVKEAVYKATFPIDSMFLEHYDVEVRLAAAAAFTKSGHSLRIYTMTRPRLIALALLTS